MIFVKSDNFTTLYTKNIIGELFPNLCFSSTENLTCESLIYPFENGVRSVIKIDGDIFEATEYFSKHLNDRLATTCAIGKSVFAYAKTKGIEPPPYGVLVGVRPFKIAVDLLSRFDYDQVIDKLKNTYLVSDDKIDLLLNAAMYDQKQKMNHHKRDASIYISIPFCPTRCNYCSFVSSAAPSKLDLIDLYLKSLLNEIDLTANLINDNSINVKSVYIGGGTPTILSAEQLKLLLAHISERIDGKSLVEFTLEAGRPDTIDEAKLDVMKSHGVTRTCVNCQSTEDNVLKAIGRNHSAEDFFKAFELVKSYNFDTINTDVIAGLNGDSFETFKKTIDDVISLSPESITVHTLYVKKSSTIKLQEMFELNKNIDSYIEYAKNECILNGFLPYYLYKQKYSVGNHENVGYCRHLHECYYNIAMMNEIEHIFGIGAGATSRLIGCNSNNKIEHFANYKYPTEYISNDKKIENNINLIGNFLKEK